jgi:tRNA G18 (ribose-2'-O)-methylase SpoU
MVGRVNSLNVATSAAVVLYEAARQRALTGAGGRVTG